MAEAGGFSLLPGTANAGNANFMANFGALANVGQDAKQAIAERAILDFSIQSTRKTVEILQAQVQLLTMRVDALEKQNAFYLQQLQLHGLGSSGGGQQPLGVVGAAGGTGTSPFLSPKQPNPSGAADSPLATGRQLEDGLPRRGLSPNTANGSGCGVPPLLTSPSQPLPSEMFGANAVLARQQQHLAAAMAQHQREEAIFQMLQGQASPSTMTPTANFAPHGFPTAAGGVGTGLPPPPAGGPGPSDPGVGNVSSMAYLYSPNTSASPGGAGNPHLILPQHNGGASGTTPVFSVSGGAPPLTPSGSPIYGFPSNSPGGAHLVTTVTLDPNKSNSNDSLERACQQPWLKELIMKNCKNISNFTPIAKLRNLWKLNLQGCSVHVDDNVVKLISTYNRRLSRLNLCGCEKIVNATALQSLSFLFDLNLSGCSITNETIEAVANGCQQLSRLAINSCPAVTDISSLRRLKELKLLYCRYSGHISPHSIVQVLQEIGSGLLTLNVDGVKFAQLPNLRGPDPVTGCTLPGQLALKNLNMKDNTELTTLSWLTSFPNAEKHFPNLEMLDVEGCTNLAEYGKLHNFRNLKLLRLSKTGVSQETVDNVITRCPTVSVVYLDGCPNVTSVGAFAKMQSLTKIVVDPALNALPASVNGLAALYQTNRIEVIFVGHNSNQGSGGGGTSASPNGSPTGATAPPMPTSAKK